jgi:glycosyltransferase involved in cell wall biosynthesis
MNGDLKMYRDDGIEIYPDFENHPISYAIRRVPGLCILSKLFRYLENGWRINHIIEKVNQRNPIDLIEFSEGGDFWTTFKKKYRYISHLHGSAFTFKKQSGNHISIGDWLQRRAELFFIYRANKVVSPSKAMLGYVESEMNTALIADIIPYPISDDDDDEMVYDCDPIPNSSIKVNLIFASRNDPVKGGELLINALKRLSRPIKEKIQVNIYGYKPKYDTSKIKFLSVYNFISRDELKLVYKNADICIIPSLFDNSPNTVYEAMSHAKIIVASSVGGISEIIGDQKNGFLFESNNVQDLVNKLTDAIELVLSGDHIKMCQNTRKRIILYAGLQNNVRKRIALYPI